MSFHLQQSGRHRDRKHPSTGRSDEGDQPPQDVRTALGPNHGTAADGQSIKLADPGAELVGWQLSYAELVDAERTALEEFFSQVEGSLRTFTFLDPAGHLLAWSERPGEAVWEKGPLLSVVGAQPYALGTSCASTLRNTGGGPQSLQQTIEAPANYVYAFSLYARAAAPL